MKRQRSGALITPAWSILVGSNPGIADVIEHLSFGVLRDLAAEISTNSAKKYARVFHVVALDRNSSNETEADSALQLVPYRFQRRTKSSQRKLCFLDSRQIEAARPDTA